MSAGGWFVLPSRFLVPLQPSLRPLYISSLVGDLVYLRKELDAAVGDGTNEV